ncbi:hypothetical protein BTT_64330 (plasmid) [Bacillus thuringiensis serovar morrisoni str. 4AA1]|uniref:hypothetical protein n=1 Tax=Bacillus TaxID=1386 RepID=UPI0005CF7702|nr:MULTISPECIES: hypothetical protein [Bacillus]AJQ62752.1 hypothetical protein SD98_31400 [Bacillus thuringiensis serovar morrisoni]MED3102242.1 hypothetical protein [Bacillus thuringiensis]MRA99431.1 hypothetical protein [Bacillus thuringiensis]OTY44119.1 hypothetical protein BK736_05495 [Bacillus thuringiensis serovar poloniensis]RNG17670.1 hypothetical protein EEL55_31260 [Bacillus thuringiensis]
MENKALLDEIEQLKQQVAHLTFKQNLLFTNGSVERLVFDYDLTQIQFTQIMDLMDEYRKMIGEGKQVSHHEFEMQINAIVPDHGYHFAEAITYAFWENNRWEEVFNELYRGMEKYKYVKREI